MQQNHQYQEEKYIENRDEVFGRRNTDGDYYTTGKKEICGLWQHLFSNELTKFDGYLTLAQPDNYEQIYGLTSKISLKLYSKFQEYGICRNDRRKNTDRRTIRDPKAVMDKLSGYKDGHEELKDTIKDDFGELAKIIINTQNTNAKLIQTFENIKSFIDNSITDAQKWEPTNNGAPYLSLQENYYK